jgi:hypothetical protein
LADGNLVLAGAEWPLNRFAGSVGKRVHSDGCISTRSCR